MAPGSFHDRFIATCAVRLVSVSGGLVCSGSGVFCIFPARGYIGWGRGCHAESHANRLARLSVGPTIYAAS